ncbi:MAG: hypothetical protein ACI8XD_001503 [Thermoproteota archaeon]|jgi:hypothetical protein
MSARAAFHSQSDTAVFASWKRQQPAAHDALKHIPEASSATTYGYP